MDRLEIEKYLIEQKNMDYDEAISTAIKFNGMSPEEVDRILDGDSSCKQDCKQSQPVDITPAYIVSKIVSKPVSKSKVISLRFSGDDFEVIKQQADELGMKHTTLLQDVIRQHFKLN